VTYTPDGKALMFGSEGRQSEVERVALGRDSASGGAARSPSASGGGAAAADPGDTSGITYGLVILGGGAALVLGLKRLLRRG
jgi:hypothetical protein